MPSQLNWKKKVKKTGCHLKLANPFDSILRKKLCLDFCFILLFYSRIQQILSPSLIPQLKVSSHLIICNCAAVKAEWRSESDWFGLLIQFISDRRESNSLQITSFNPDTLMPFKIFFPLPLPSIYILKNEARMTSAS